MTRTQLHNNGSATLLGLLGNNAYRPMPTGAAYKCDHDD